VYLDVVRILEAEWAADQTLVVHVLLLVQVDTALGNARAQVNWETCGHWGTGPMIFTVTRPAPGLLSSSRIGTTTPVRLRCGWPPRLVPQATDARDSTGRYPRALGRLAVSTIRF
jgi:hypothetical protein